MSSHLLCKLAAACAAGFMASMALPAVAAELIRNGGFDATYPDDTDPPFPLPTHWQTSGFTVEGRVTGGAYFESGVVAFDSVWYGDYSGNPGNAAVMFHRARLSQQFTVSQAGEYRVSWNEATAGLDHEPFLMGDYYPEERALTYRVTLGQEILGTFSPPKGQDFTSHSFELLLQPGIYSLAFQGLNYSEYVLYGSANQYARATVGYYTLIDGVSVSAVPEPSTWLLMACGVLGLVGRAAAKGRQAAHANT